MDVHNLAPGKVPAEQFDLLLAGTDIRGLRVAEALRLHLVDGLTPKEACEQTRANRGQFSLRLKAIHEENQRVIQLIKFYSIP
ncbi:PapB/FocB family fimbrial expression transcriptional regulator [Pseudomonas sp. EMN2]|uniref:PapB/FocB family fimbrial expression transcriptional regulator n=1 Tax=Pseudomonas sp. EMN2 TaxID=2615212 RepID=UPI00129A77BE|nr:PapB/FocB family fimbrial expression transcriptional regulator [Pseudomonas sp. EMN2]